MQISPELGYGELVIFREGKDARSCQVFGMACLCHHLLKTTVSLLTKNVGASSFKGLACQDVYAYGFHSHSFDDLFYLFNSYVVIQSLEFDLCRESHLFIAI